MRILYLDQNHLSHLVRHRNDAASVRITDLLERRQAKLAISIFHVIETASPRFSSARDLSRFVDACEVAWCRNPAEIYCDELSAVLDKELFGIERTFSAFGDGPLDMFGVKVSPDLHDDAALFFGSFEKAVVWALYHPEGRDETIAAMKLAAAGEQAKHDAALEYARDHSHSIVFNLEYHLAKEYRPPPGRQVPQLTKADLYEIFEKCGRLDAFPMLGSFRRLEEKRMTDKSFKAIGNHVVDEWHAQYGPYVDAIALDSNTWTRVKNMKLSFAARATAELGEVATILGL